jgi:hypothetical protein
MATVVFFTAIILTLAELKNLVSEPKHKF